MDYDEQLARANEQELWEQQQREYPKREVKVNINWKQLLKKAKDDSKCTDFSK